MASTRRLAAILAADVAGYSRLMGADEEGTHERLKAHFRELVDPKIKEHRGRIVKNTGDGLLAEFASVVDAVRCAVEIQRGMIDREPDVPEERRISFRIGVNLGDVIAEEHDIFGDGVNVAARLEALAEPGGICISRMVRDQVRDKLPYRFEDLGEKSVKNIARLVRAYALRPEAPVHPLAPGAPAAPPVPKPVVAPRLSIVVLPFTNLSDDPEQQYFADGITEDLTTDLSRISGSFVIARNTAFTYKGQSVDVKRVSRELGVRYVLEGSVRRVGDQVRVNVQLVDGESGAHLWADRFDTDRANLAQAQDEITGRLARTLNLELVEASVRRSELERAVDPDARDLVMRGWVLSSRMASATTQEEARRAFERALEIDPESVDARIGLGEVLVSGEDMEGGSNSLHQNITRAEQLLFEALERDPTRSRAHFVMGLIRRWQGRLPDAKIELEAAIALDPNQASGHRQLGVTLMFLGQPEAAIPQLEKSTRLSPYDPFIALNYNALGRCHLFLGQVDEAIDLLRKARTASLLGPISSIFGSLNIGASERAAISIGGTIIIFSGIALTYMCIGLWKGLCWIFNEMLRRARSPAVCIMHFVSKHWRGEYSLPRSYWLNGVLFGFLLLAMGGVLVEETEAASESPYSGFSLITVSLYSVFYIAAGIWQTGGIWRSAKRRKGFWASAANVSVVILWLTFLGNLGETREHSSPQHPASSAPAPQPLIPTDKPDTASNTEPWKQVGEWSIRYDYADSGDGTPTGCFMSRGHYNSALRLGVHGPNDYYLLFTNESLSQRIEDRKYCTLSLNFDKLTPWSVTAEAKSFASGNRFLIFRISNRRFFAELVSSNSLAISRSGSPIVEFTVAGAKEALAAMLNCQESHRRNPYKNS